MSLGSIGSGLANARDDVRAAIGQAAQTTGVAFSYLLAQAKSESGLDPAAKATTSSASGLYQFLDQSWLAIVKKHGSEHGLGWAAGAINARSGGGFTVDATLKQAVMGLREQAGPAAMMAAAYASDNAAGLSQSLGRAANATDLYFAHFLGLGGATKFLQAAGTAPASNAAALFPREASANRGIFYDKAGNARSLADVYQLMGQKLASAGGDSGAAVAGGSAAPGSLVATPEEAQAAAMRYAALNGTSDNGSDGSDGTDVASALAALGHNGVNLLRPTPAQAKLAYLMLSSTADIGTI